MMRGGAPCSWPCSEGRRGPGREHESEITPIIWSRSGEVRAGRGGVGRGFTAARGSAHGKKSVPRSEGKRFRLEHGVSEGGWARFSTDAGPCRAQPSFPGRPRLALSVPARWLRWTE